MNIAFRAEMIQHNPRSTAHLVLMSVSLTITEIVQFVPKLWVKKVTGDNAQVKAFAKNCTKMLQISC